MENVETDSNEKGKKLSDNNIIKLVASIETKSEHPIARSIVESVTTEKLKRRKYSFCVIFLAPKPKHNKKDVFPHD